MNVFSKKSVLDLYGKVLVAGGLQVGLLGPKLTHDGARTPALGQTRCWPRPSPSPAVVVPLGECMQERGKVLQTAMAARVRSEKMGEEQLCRHPDSEEGGEEMLKESKPAAYGGPHTRAGGCLKNAVTTLEPMVERAPGRTCGPIDRGAQAGAGFLAGLTTPRGTNAEAVCS